MSVEEPRTLIAYPEDYPEMAWSLYAGGPSSSIWRWSWDLSGPPAGDTTARPAGTGRRVLLLYCLSYSDGTQASLISRVIPPLLDESPHVGCQDKKKKNHSKLIDLRTVAERYWTRLPPKVESGIKKL